MPARKVRTTVALSADLLAAVDAVVQEGAADSRNDFLDRAIRKQLQDSRRAALDAEFAWMARDRTYREEAVEVGEEFAEADWEALRTAEKSA
jgi:metal-responsive CopG/Arc/MetJ family transcriptional regulator